MAFKVILPKIGLSEESSIIGEWFKKKGDPVQKGDPLFTVETDKSTTEIEAEGEGTLLEVFYGEGDEAAVLSTVCIVGQPGENIDELMPQDQGEQELEKEIAKEEVEFTQEAAVQEQATTIAKTSSAEGEGIVKISPRAKILAQSAKVDHRLAEATGPRGRIIERDILALMENKKALTSAAYMNNSLGVLHHSVEGTGIGGKITLEDLERTKDKKEILLEKPIIQKVEKLRSIRKAIATNMMKSLHNTAQLTLNTTFDARDILSYRKKLKAKGECLELNNITINDIIMYAVSRTLPQHAYLNTHLVEDEIIFFENVHLGVAVDTPRGLMVPTIFNSDVTSLNDLSSQVKTLAQKCNEGTIAPEELQGGTFTVTNLGSLDVEHFTPVLNPPETGILGVGSMVYRMEEVDGEYLPYPAIGLSLTFDHRVVDGAPAARFLKDLKSNLENFTILLAK